MRWLIFPLGRAYPYPSDALGRQIAKKMQECTTLRDRLTRYCYIGKEDTDPTGRMENAMQALSASQETVNKIRQATSHGDFSMQADWPDTIEAAFSARVISQQERERCLRAHALCQDAIAVDAF